MSIRDALVEYSGGDASTAKEIADAMAEEKRKALESAQKLKLKGKTPAEMLASKKANAEALAKAEAEYNHWQQMAAVEQSRQEAERARQEEDARRVEAERKAEEEARAKAEEERLAEEKRKQEEEPDKKKGKFEYFTGTIGDLISAAKEKGSKLIKKALSPVSGKLISDLANKGVVISDEYKHVIDNNAVKHTLNKHSGEEERLRGQVPITEKDIENVNDIIENYDDIETSKNKRGQDVIIYRKTYSDGTTVYVEEVRTGRKELAMSSMRKQKSRNLTDADAQKTTLSSDLNSASEDKGTTLPSEQKTSEGEKTSEAEKLAKQKEREERETKRKAKEEAIRKKAEAEEAAKRKAAEEAEKNAPNIDENTKKLGEVSDKGVDDSEMPTDMAYRTTDVNEVADILESGVMREMPEGASVEGSEKTHGGFQLGRTDGRSHGGKGFSKGKVWKSTTAGGSAQKVVIGVPGDKVQWQVGMHGKYGKPKPFGEIEDGKAVLLKFNEQGEVEGVKAEDMRFWVQGRDGKYYELKPNTEKKDVAHKEEKDVATLEKEWNEAETHAQDVEQEWSDKIQDYVGEHYPTQATVSAETNSKQGLKEREAMSKDPVLAKMRKDANEAIKEAEHKAYDAWKALDKVQPTTEPFEKPKAEAPKVKPKKKATKAPRKGVFETAAEIAAANRTDKQGNPVDENGKLVTEKAERIEDLTDEDFTAPTRSVTLPTLPKLVDDAIGAKGKPVVIKKNIFGKNKENHKDLTPAQSREILNNALYRPDLYGQNKKKSRPYNWILINSAEKHSSVILEVNHGKDNLEIVNWHYLDDVAFKQKEKQAVKEGGLILTLKSAAGDTHDGLSENKGSEVSEKKQEKGGGKGAKPSGEAVEIVDVGEKIGGAKKDKYAAMDEQIKKGEDEIGEQLAKFPAKKVFSVFAEKTLRESGVSNEAVSLIMAVKKTLKSKPRTAIKMERWRRLTAAKYELCHMAMEDWNSAKSRLESPYATQLAATYNAIMAVGGFDGGMEIGDALLTQYGEDAKMFKDGKEYPLAGQWRLAQAGKYSGTYATYEDAAEALRGFAGENVAIDKTGKRKEVKLAVWRDVTGGIFIAPRHKSDIVLQDGFKSAEEARTYLREHEAEMQERYRNLMEDTKTERKENRPRVGRDYRAGKDVQAEEFRETFGFRGVEFGNWTNQSDRQNSLNEAYDALMDLASVCGVSPKALSLDGKLGIAFGARGGGKFNAHYELDKVVINLTKTKGAGSLAHEWFHALDHYFAGNGRSMTTSAPYLAERKEMQEAWKELKNKILQSEYYQRSMRYARLHNSDYWTKPTELGARAFSTWVVNQLSRQGTTNDYLANELILREDEATDSQKKYNVYPMDKDADWMDEAFGGLFSTMQERVDESTGNHILYQKSDGTMEAGVFGREAALRDALVERMRKAGLDVRMDVEEGQRVLDEENGETRMSAKKRRALETASLGETPRSLTVVSSADGTKVLKNIDALITEFENSATQPKTFLGDVAKALGANRSGSASEYATFETKNGRIVTIRLANHNAKVSTFDRRDESEGISIVVSAKENDGINNDGNAHIVEYFYDAIKLRRAEGKPLAEILKSIKQTLYSGDFKDATGLAERQEVNAADASRFHKVFHGSGADFDHFDHSHMGEGEGAQAYGWGTYLTEVRGIGKRYAIQNSKNHNSVVYNIADLIPNSASKTNALLSPSTHKKTILGLIDKAIKTNEYLCSFDSPFNENYENALERLYHARDILTRDSKPNLYTVEIPDDTGNNYLYWAERLTDRQKETMAGALRKLGLDLSDWERRGFSLDGIGKDVYWFLVHALRHTKKWEDENAKKSASKFLSSLGFVGIKYPAEYLSGGRKDNKMNYVIFNEADAKITDHIRFFRTPDGEAYGFTVGGKIFIDPRIATSATPIHEYSHLWGDMLRRTDPKQWTHLVKELKGSYLWEEMRKRYPELKTDDEIADEVFATFSGRRGAERLREEARRISEGKGGVFTKAKALETLQNVKNAIRDFWRAVQKLFGINRYYRADELADMALKDLLEGKNPLKDETTMEHRESVFDAERRVSEADESKSVEIEENEINDKFNARLAELVKNPNQKDKILHLGRSSKFLTEGGLADAEIILEFDKLARKSKEGYKHEHPFDMSDIKDLPKALSSPIAVFDNTNDKNDGKVILTELKKEDRNFIVAVKTSVQNRKGGVVLEVNQITTLFPKDAKGIISWFNSGKATNIDKEKALRFIEALPNHPGTTIKKEELLSAAKVVRDSDNAKSLDGKVGDEGMKFRLLADNDPKTKALEALPKGELVPVYRNVQAFSDDALGSPMAFFDTETGERRTLEGGRWNYSEAPKVELTEEQQRKLDELNKNGYLMVDGKKTTELPISDSLKFVKPKTKEAQLQYLLKKNPEDSGTWAAYDPYDHAIETPLNTQFAEAYKRPNLVVVRSLIPKSEITEPFQADYALLPTGAHQWNNGRTLYLSRYSKIDKVLSRKEEAELIDKYWKEHEGKREALKSHRDYNRFVPEVRKELENMGYRFEFDGKELTPEESLALDKQREAEIIPGREGRAPYITGEDIDRINAKMAGKWVGEPKEAMEDEMAARVDDLSKKLTTPVRIVRTAEEVEALPTERQRRQKGSYNTRTGEVTIVVPNNANLADVENTFMHEVVGHDGLRVLFPEKEKLDNALDELYGASNNSIKATIDRRAQKMYDAEVERLLGQKRSEAEARAEADRKRDQFKRDATEEYGADLAGRIGEEGFEKMGAEEKTFWGKLKAVLQKALDALLHGLKIPGKRKWGDKDWAYVLHEAYKRKKNGGKPSVFDVADTEAMREKTGFGESTDNGVMFRDGSPVKARDLYEKKVKSSRFQAREALQDSMLGLKTMMESVMKGEGDVIMMPRGDVLNEFKNIAISRCRYRTRAWHDGHVGDHMAKSESFIRRV